MNMRRNNVPDSYNVGGITREIDTLGLRVDDVLHVLVYLPNSVISVIQYRQRRYFNTHIRPQNVAQRR